VILVEDESQQLFLVAVAPILGFDLDAYGVSVIAVDGEDSYGKYFTLFDALAISYFGLKDKHWGNPQMYPDGRFFSFGCELEDYLDQHGLVRLRAKVITEVGTSKARVAGILAGRLTEEQVPQLFRDLLQAACQHATGEPANQVPLAVTHRRAATTRDGNGD